jgi:hypothetical protein
MISTFNVLNALSSTSRCIDDTLNLQLLGASPQNKPPGNYSTIFVKKLMLIGLRFIIPVISRR